MEMTAKITTHDKSIMYSFDIKDWRMEDSSYIFVTPEDEVTIFPSSSVFCITLTPKEQ